MNKLFWQTAKIAPVLFAASLFAANGASAQSISADKEAVYNTLQQINNYQKLESGNLPQVTNVNQLRDVSPTDWAYEALRSLVDRYGCISGFPNQTYRGDQPLSRYEFAAGLNSCLHQIDRLIASQEGVGQEELDTINRLTQEFEAELATIGGRVDEIESRTADLEDSQFSTTTKLKGEAIFAISDAYGGGIDFEDTVGDFNGDGEENDQDLEDFVGQNGGDLDGDGNIENDEVDEFKDNFEDDSELDDETTFSSRVRLNFDTSFFGKDRLRTRLEGGNITRYDSDLTGTNSSRLGFDSNNDFDIEVSDLHYRFPVGEKIRVWVGPFGLDLDDIFAVTYPMLESGSSGALSRFSRRNPIAFRGTEGAGAGVNLELIEDRVGINFGYLTDDANSPDEREGLFNGSFSAGAQLEVSPFDALELSATYVRNYQTAGSVNQSGSTVSGNATEPFGEVDTAANKIGLGAKFDIGEKIILAGWGGYADVSSLGQVDANGDDADLSGEIWSWGANISVLDLVKEGSKLSFAGGMVPKFISDDAVAEGQAGLQEDRDTSYLLEALYQFPLNDNIAITPGAYIVINPNHVDTNDSVIVGTIRTTFKF
ncbi:MAG: iron uptake porin [Pleurocapsa sp.]